MKLSIQSQISLLDLVKPSAGFELDFCIGTSYSLNLECLLQLGLTSRGFSIVKDEVSAQEAFEMVGDISSKFLLFCNSCKIKEVDDNEVAVMNPEYRRFWGLLDETIKVIHPKVGKTCFHPKVVILRYKSSASDEVLYKLIVSSRNLTLDLSWDIAGGFVGTKGTSKGRNKNLISFVNYLEKETKGNVSDRQRKKISQIKDELSSIEFQSPFGKKEFEFQFQSFEEQRFNFDLHKFERLVAVSPFVNVLTVKKLGESLKEFILITSSHGKSALQGVELPAAMKTFIFRAEDIDLHTKLYVGHDGSGKTKVIFGSANLTSNGLVTGNVEAVVCIEAPKSFYHEFIDSFIYPENKGEKILAEWLEELVPDKTKSSEIEETEPGDAMGDYLAAGTFFIKYDSKKRIVNLRFSENKKVFRPSAYSAVVRLIGSEHKFDIDQLIGQGRSFSCSLSDLTRLLRVEIKEADSIVSCFMTIAEGDIPVRQRSKAVAGTVIKSMDDFLAYLSFVLGETPAESIAHQNLSGKQNKKVSRRSTLPPAILEKLLLGCQADDSLIERIENGFQAILEKENTEHLAFSRFWKEFRNAINRMKRVG